MQGMAHPLAGKGGHPLELGKTTHSVRERMGCRPPALVSLMDAASDVDYETQAEPIADSGPKEKIAQGLHGFIATGSQPCRFLSRPKASGT